MKRTIFVFTEYRVHFPNHAFCAERFDCFAFAQDSSFFCPGAYENLVLIHHFSSPIKSFVKRSTINFIPKLVHLYHPTHNLLAIASTIRLNTIPEDDLSQREAKNEN